MQKILIDTFGLIGFGGLTAGLYLKYGLADSCIISGGLLIAFSVLAGLRRRA